MMCSLYVMQLLAQNNCILYIQLAMCFVHCLQVSVETILYVVTDGGSPSPAKNGHE